MAFKSQRQASKKVGRRGSSAGIVVSQSYKPSTNSEEMSFRVATSLLNEAGLDIGDKVDVLFDEDSLQWMITKESDGFTISGKKDGPTGLIRYTLKKDHIRLTNDSESLPMKLDSDDETIDVHDGKIVFCVHIENDMD